MGEFKERETEYNETVEELTDGFIDKMEQIIFDSMIETGKALERLESLKEDLEFVAPEDKADYVKDKFYRPRRDKNIPYDEDMLWRRYMEELKKVYFVTVMTSKGEKEESDD